MQTCIIEIAYGAVAVEPSDRKPPDGLTCSVLEKVFRGARYLDQSIPSITDENADRSYLSGNLAGENVVVSMTKLATHMPYNFPRELPEIRIPT